jgi:hypothetical protein
VSKLRKRRDSKLFNKDRGDGSTAAKVEKKPTACAKVEKVTTPMAEGDGARAAKVESKPTACAIEKETVKAKKDEEPTQRPTKPIDKFGRDRKKTAGVNQAMSRASSAMSGSNTARSSKRRPVGASTSTEDDASVVSSTVSVASSSTAVQSNLRQRSNGLNNPIQHRKSNSLIITSTQSKSETKQSANVELNSRQSHSDLLARARSHRRAASSASSTPLVVSPAEELDDSLIFSDLLPPSPSSREQSVERGVKVQESKIPTPMRTLTPRSNRGRKNVVSNVSVGSNVEIKGESVSSSSSVQSPPRMKRNTLSGDSMSTMHFDSEKRTTTPVKTPARARAPSPKLSPIISKPAGHSSPSPNRLVRRNRSLSRPRLARNEGPIEEKLMNTKADCDKAIISTSSLETGSHSSVSASSCKVEAPTTPTRAQSLSAFRAARKGSSVMNAPGTKNKTLDDKNSSKMTVASKPQAGSPKNSNETTLSPTKTNSLASLRAVTNRGRKFARPVAAEAVTNSLTTPPRSVIRADKTEAAPRQTPPSRFNRRSRSLSQSRVLEEASPATSKMSSHVKATAPIESRALTGSPIDARHATATEMRRKHRRRSNSMPRHQSQTTENDSALTNVNSTKNFPFKQSPGVARVNKLNKKLQVDEPEPKAEVILHGQFASTPRATANSAPVVSHTAIMSILSKKAKNKSTFYVPIAQLCQAILPIQTLARMFLAKLALEKRKASIVRLQAIFRRWRCEHYLSSCIFLAVQLQASYRGYIAREQTYFIHLGVLAVTRLQACYRGKAARRDLRYQAYCATRIQATIRGHWQCVEYVETWSNIVLVQSVARMRSARKKYLTELAALMKAIAEAAATKIQTCWRRFVCYGDFCDTLVDIVTIQSAVRRLLAQEQLCRMQLELAKSTVATKMAASWRAFVIRREYIITIGGKLC